MARSLRIAFVASLLSIAACAKPRMNVVFEPYSVSADVTPVTSDALVVYRDDATELTKAGGKEIGRVVVTGKKVKDRKQLEAFAAHFAAAHGATHLVLVTSSQGTHAELIPGSGPMMTANGMMAGGGPPLVIETKTDTLVFDAYKVPRGEWTSLPPMLMPREQ